MHALTTSVAVAAVVAVAGASPVETLNKRSFTIKQVAVPKKTKLRPAQQVLKTYAKFGKYNAAPDAVKAAAAAAASGTVEADPEAEDVEYLSPVTVGGNTLNLDFDTGSADLWVYSTLQSTSQTKGHDIYKPTVKQIKNASWKISYGDGSGASGKVYADKVVVGGVTATSQIVEAATTVSSSFLSDTADDGLLGLAFSSINTVTGVKATTFFDTVKPTLAEALFTASLKKGVPGSYDFGFIDSSKYTGDITYVDVDNSQGFWGFTADGYSTGTASIGSESIGDAIADTGTTLLYVPDDAASSYYAAVKGAKFSNSDGVYEYPCSATLPAWNVEIGGATFTVPGTNINAGPIAPNSKTCLGGIQNNDGIGLTIFGDVFLKSVFAVFDQTEDSPRLGFATST